MATRTWLGTVDSEWATAGNWQGGVAAISGDSVVISADTVNDLTTITTGGAINLIDLTDIDGFMLVSGGTSSVHVSGVVNLSGSEINADVVPFTFSGTGAMASVVISGAAVLSGVFTLDNCTLSGGYTVSGTVTFTNNTSLSGGTFTGAIIELRSATLGLDCSLAGAIINVTSDTVLNGGTLTAGGVTIANIAAIAAAVVAKTEFTDIRDRVLLALPDIAPGLSNGLPKVDSVTGHAKATVSEYVDGASPDDFLFDSANGIETGLTLRQAMRLILAVIAGKAADSTGTVTFKRRDGTTTALTVVHDSLGNRSSSTIGTL